MEKEGQMADDTTPDFAASREAFESLVGFFASAQATGLTHGELEARLWTDGREVLRRVLQDHFNYRAMIEVRREEVTDAAGHAHRAVESDHDRELKTMLGEVEVNRLAYRKKGADNLYPADAALNLPDELYSHGLRRLAAIESTRDSYVGSLEAIERACGQHVSKRQVEQLAERAAVDFEAFYEARRPVSSDPDDVLVLSADGKGIVMRPEALREETKKKAAKSRHKLRTRLSRGEKRNCKRMAEIGTVYDLKPVSRRPADIFADKTERPEPPKAKNKWCTVSVVDDTAAVIDDLFDEAARRDPDKKRAWVALVDGNAHQIATLTALAKERGVDLPIVCDFVHVLQYVWGAARCFFEQGEVAAEDWVREKALEILSGKATSVAGAIRRKATYRELAPDQRAKADEAADYLIAKAPYLNYHKALANGWPIATGVIEGAVRHVVKDRMDRTGARWGLEGAETVLKLRALRANGDFEEYFAFHLRQEQRRVHGSRYAGGVLPKAA
jgi:uncharacterized protein UPF0236